MIPNNMYNNQNGSPVNQQFINNFASQFNQLFPNTTPEQVVNNMVNSGKVPQGLLNQAVNFANQNSWVFK